MTFRDLNAQWRDGVSFAGRPILETCDVCKGDGWFEDYDEENERDDCEPCLECGATGAQPTEDGAALLTLLAWKRNRLDI